LADLTRRYETGRLARLGPPADRPGAKAYQSPQQVAAFLGPELADLAQEQLRALLLTTQQTLLRYVFVSQGTLDAAPARLVGHYQGATGAPCLVASHWSEPVRRAYLTGYCRGRAERLREPVPEVARPARGSGRAAR
jgi:hypothetical protein